MLLFGILFAGIGALFTVIGVALAVSGTMDLMGRVIFIGMGLLFLLIGVVVLVKLWLEHKAVADAVAAPDRRIRGAKIIDYVYVEGVTVNGVPPFAVVLEFYDPGTRESRQLVTDQRYYKHRGIQLGSSCDLCIKDNKVFIDPKSVRIL